MRRVRWMGAMVLLLAGRAEAQDDLVMKAMRDEMARSVQDLRLDTLSKPYFIAYRIQESSGIDVAGTFGSLVHSATSRNRRLTVEVRVGDYAFDNTNFMGMPGSNFAPGGSGFAVLPLEDDYLEFRRQLWLATDGAYKRALEELSQKRAALRSRTQTDQTPDFSHEAVSNTKDSVTPEALALPAAEEMVRALSGLFRQMPDIFSSSVQLNVETVRTRFLDSEGTSFTRVSPWVSLRVVAATQAADGAPLEDFVAFYGSRPGDLPDRARAETVVKDLGSRLAQLRTAPVLDQYSGPVLFEDQAAAELFNQVLGPRLLATRRPVSGNPQFQRFAERQDNPFLDQLGGRVLPASFKVEDNPTILTFAGQSIGGYRVDDDGVPARGTTVVERGVLKTLLSSRVPARGILRSSGNRWGNGPVVSNLFVATDSGLALPELKQRLLGLVAQRGGQYGIIVRRLSNPAFTLVPDVSFMFSMMDPSSGGPPLRTVAAYRVYPDGREELVRNGDISGLAAASFKDIVAASSARTVYTAPFAPRVGFAGANGYAASYVVPSVLFEDVTIRGPRGEIPRPPVAPHPYFQGR